MTGNAKHRAALEQTADVVDQLRIDIHVQLEVLREHNHQLEDLAGTRQSIGLGFQTPEAKAARERQDAADRAAARSAIAPSTAALGHAWMNGPAGSVPGVHEAPVTMPAVSVSAQILFTLQHHVRRLAKPAIAAAAAEVPGGRGRIPTGSPTSDGNVDQLAGHLATLVDIWTSRPGLEALLRDLEHLERLASDVIDGPAKTNHPDPCPWCGRDSLAFHHREPGRDEMFVRCDGKHPCVCNDQWCPCQTNPIKHRHEWVNSGRAKNPVDGRSPHALSQLIAHRKETQMLETKALEAVERVKQLHAEVPIYPWADDCPSPDSHKHHVDLSAEGPPICRACDPLDVFCEGCSHVAGADVSYPCPTIQALDEPTETES